MTRPREYDLLTQKKIVPSRYPIECQPERDRIAFVFKDAGGGIHTTFAYDRAEGAWSWAIDNDVKGTLTPFARVKLTRWRSDPKTARRWQPRRATCSSLAQGRSGNLVVLAVDQDALGTSWSRVSTSGC